MEAETLEKIERIRTRINMVQQSIKPIQRRYAWLKNKLEKEENLFVRRELEAMSLCWSLLREEIKRLKLFNNYLNTQGEKDGNGTTDQSN